MFSVWHVARTSCRKISWSLEAARFGFVIFPSLWNLTSTSAAALPRCLPIFWTKQALYHPIVLETISNTAYHYIDVITTTIASQITSLTVVYSTVYSDADQSKHQSSASLALVWRIHRDRWIPRTKGQLRGNVSIWWRHHVTRGCMYIRHTRDFLPWINIILGTEFLFSSHIVLLDQQIKIVNISLKHSHLRAHTSAHTYETHW